MSIEIRNVSKQFGDFHALRDVSLDIASGELIALLGLGTPESHGYAARAEFGTPEWEAEVIASSVAFAEACADNDDAVGGSGDGAGHYTLLRVAA